MSVRLGTITYMGMPFKTNASNYCPLVLKQLWNNWPHFFFTYFIKEPLHMFEIKALA